MSETAAPELDEFTHTMSQIARDQRVAMSEFSDAMKRRDHLNERMARRSAGLHQLFMLSIVLLIGVLLYFVFTLQKTVNEFGAASASALSTTEVQNQASETIQEIALWRDAMHKNEVEVGTLRNELAGLKTELAKLRAAATESQQTKQTVESAGINTGSARQISYYPYGYPYYQRMSQK